MPRERLLGVRDVRVDDEDDEVEALVLLRVAGVDLVDVDELDSDTDVLLPSRPFRSDNWRV